MPNWKKLIVSGSSANLTNLSVTNAVTASYFKGDGSALTGITSDISETATIADSFSNQTSVATSHNFGTKNVQVAVYDDNDAMIIPDSILISETLKKAEGFRSAKELSVKIVFLFSLSNQMLSDHKH